MTPKEKILDAALAIARYAPKKRSKYAGSAKVPWAAVENIRKALEELGVNPHHWDAAGNLEKLLRSE
jgi:hypothetical protein